MAAYHRSDVQARPEGLEELNRRVWGDKITLATTAHAAGGLGLGLLLCPGRTGWSRSVAYALLGFSLFAHLYALLAMWPAARLERAETRRAVR